MNSPVLEFDDLDLLQEVIRALRKEGAITGPQYDCGTHIHICQLTIKYPHRLIIRVYPYSPYQ